MPSARELKMRRLLEEKKQAILAEQAAEAQKVSQAETQSKPKSQEATPQSAPQTSKPSGKETVPAPETDSAPTPPQSAPTSKEPQSQDNPPAEAAKPAYFQAIGTVSGLVKSDDSEGKFIVHIGGRDYDLSVPWRFRPALSAQITEHPEQALFLRVYPHCWSQDNAAPQICFRLVHWSSENSWKTPIGAFVVRGVWQFSSRFGSPVLAIYRNRGSRDRSGRFQARYVPVEMTRKDEAQLFQDQPGVPKEEQPKRWFIEGLFQLNAEGTALVWLEDLAKPTTKIPKYEKPRKGKPATDSSGQKSDDDSISQDTHPNLTEKFGSEAPSLKDGA